MLAAVDEERPAAVDDRGDHVVVYFGSVGARDRAVALAQTSMPDAIITPLSVSDEAWAERSQASIGPVRVGRVVLTPPWAVSDLPPAFADGPPDIVITIVPSMGFGTGHHASTRLCLELLQECDLQGRSVLDVGTGSGALALAAWRLGAASVVAIDSDPDAMQSATENVLLNGAEPFVHLRTLDLADGAAAIRDRLDVITANLTGGLLQRFAETLASWLAPGGTLIVSGIQEDEERNVATVLTSQGLNQEGRTTSDGWVGLRLQRK